MEKRNNQLTFLPQRQDLKRQKPRKTTYFFQPQNTLSFNSSKKDLASDASASINNSSPKQAIANNDKPEPIAVMNVRGIPEQSSDDSFEGVRWRGNVSPKRQIDTRTILSSPLKNSEGGVSRPSNLKGASAAILNNEVTDSVLSKYGLGFESSLSQTPKVQVAYPTPNLAQSPALMKSKLFDARSVAKITATKDNFSTPSLSRLNTWIDKFTNLSEVTPESIPTTGNNLTATGVTEDSDNDDIFSDDDSLLANLNVEQITAQATQSASNSGSHIPPTIPNLHDLSVDESDPFSDDLNITDLERVQTQHEPPKISTTEEDELLEKLVSSYNPGEFQNVGAKLAFSRSDFIRYQVLSVLQSTYTVQNLKKKQLILTVRDKDDEKSRLIIRGDSTELSIQEHDIIHVILTSPSKPKLVDNSHNLLIWNPDVLISSTVVADQLFCPRKTVLQNRFKFPGETSMPLLVGTIVHEIFQACFIAEKFDDEFLENFLDNEIRCRLIEIFTLGDVVQDLKNKIREHLPFIKYWFRTFYKKTPSDIPTNQRNQKIRFSVADGLDIEENVWSPMFGIKGKVDVTLKANLQGEHSQTQTLLPMEIKTSAQYLSHQAQAALYSLLFKDRYNFDISSFLLVYTLDEGLTKKHDISVADLKSLVHLRNQISLFLKRGQNDLPDLMRQQKCDKCTLQETCMTINYMTEDGTSEDSGLNEGVYERITSHLVNKPHYAAYYKYWNELLTQEEQFLDRFNRDLWVYSAQERESEQGKALSDLIISSQKDRSTDGMYCYTFQRKQGKLYASMQNTQINKYDRVVISDDEGRFALAQGYVQELWPDSITIMTRRRIIPTTLKTDKFHRASVLKQTQTPSQGQKLAVVFRIDKDEMFYGMGMARFNVLNLFLESGDSKRRRLIVDSEPPQFDDSFKDFQIEGANLNEVQENAVRRTLGCKDYSLILGMPGTGKTTVIAHLIRILSSQNKSVLLTSYTNSAVDNILLKVKDLGVDFLRVGIPSRVHPEIRKYIPGSNECPIESFDEFELIYRGPTVVAGTCLSIHDTAFNIRGGFDYCIIDEASQVSLPLSLGPLALCDKFVLVGDHYQLPPLVKHPNPQVKAGLSKSLFETLAEKHPESVSELTYQYRMCEDIMFLSNALIYDGRLRCGSETVACQGLTIPNPDQLTKGLKHDIPIQQQWLRIALQEDTKCLFLNHDPLQQYETVTGENVTNLTEIALIRETVEGLCACGVKESSIGVMTLYRSQLKILNEVLKHRPSLEILTADRFQGRDKDCIIISLVRSNKDQKAGDLIRDWRRVNVALTRARSKLLVFGSISTLAGASTIGGFIGLFKKRNWIYNLPPNANEVYDFYKECQRENMQKKASNVKKIGNKALGPHVIVREILQDMDVNTLYHQ